VETAGFRVAENRPPFGAKEPSRFNFLGSHEAIRAWGENMTMTMRRLWGEEEGQDLTEYALLIVLISLVAIATMTTLGQAISDVFSNAATNMTTAT
jgi:Flp pilus assembly pilin Flp